MIVHKDNCVSRKSIIVFVRMKVFLAISIAAICNNHNEGIFKVFQGQVFQFKLFISLARNVMIIPNVRPNRLIHKSEKDNMNVYIGRFSIVFIIFFYNLFFQFKLLLSQITFVCVQSSIYDLLNSLIGHFTKCGDNYTFFLRNGQIRRMQTNSI